MPVLESTIEAKLIQQLCLETSRQRDVPGLWLDTRDEGQIYSKTGEESKMGKRTESADIKGRKEMKGRKKGMTPAGMTHSRLPNGFGTIRYLGAGRRYPYAVHPPGPSGKQRPAAICYVIDWYTGLAVLASWHAGMYQAGMEREIDRRILNGNSENPAPALIQVNRWTVEDVWNRFYEWKFGQQAVRQLSAATEENYRMVWKKLGDIRERVMCELSIEELQAVVNAAGKNYTIVSKTLQLLRSLYRFAVPRGYCEKDIAQYVEMPDTESAEHHNPFMDEELKRLWAHRDDPVVRMILIMCYSGFRIGAWKTMRTELAEGYFQGGIKTECGKNRKVPIHSAIRPLVEELLREQGGCTWTDTDAGIIEDDKMADADAGIGGGGCVRMDEESVSRLLQKSYLCGAGIGWFRKQMKRKLREIGIDGPERQHSPHSCRHTFSRLCESYGVREADRKRMMGHSFGDDITNGVYGHRTVEELRQEIEKILIPRE